MAEMCLKMQTSVQTDAGPLLPKSDIWYAVCGNIFYDIFAVESLGSKQMEAFLPHRAACPHV